MTKITDVQVLAFKTTTRLRGSKYGYRWGTSTLNEPRETTSTITKIMTDDGVEGYWLGGDRATVEATVKPLLLGEDPLDREKLWHWMQRFGENMIGVIDCALWDLYGRMVGLPVHKLLGGCRDKIKAYASSFPNMGQPEEYAEHALSCKEQGYTAYKIHPYCYWDPYKWEPAPLQPSSPEMDIEICRAVREAVGDDMVLMLDSVSNYTLQEALWVGRELEKLSFYWLEEPMLENRMEAYRRLTRELDIAICSPEKSLGGIFHRAEWVLQGASDMCRGDIGKCGGITGLYKLVMLCQAFGIQCEVHGGGWAHIQVLGATPQSTCEYYERGLLRPDVDNNVPPPYLKAIPDPMDDQGNVLVPTTPGLGMEFNWDYIEEHRVEA